MRKFWNRYQNMVLYVAAILMAIAAAVWLTYEFWRLLPFNDFPRSAVDLKLRWWEVDLWFDGEPAYHKLSDAVYPPASYLMLWPLLGWLDIPAARCLWASVSLLFLVFLVALTVRFSNATTRKTKWIMALLSLSAYPVGATVGNGQLGLWILLCLMSCLPLLLHKERRWYHDLLIGLLMLLALVKPSISACFFWIVLFCAGTLRPAVITCAAYAVLTVWSSLYQKVSVLKLMQIWFNRGVEGVEYGSTRGHGAIAIDLEGQLQITSINVHSLLGIFQLKAFNTHASFAVLLLLGIWVYWYRKISLWIVFAFTALVSRFCTYHGWYDDVVLLLPLIALFRICQSEPHVPDRYRTAAGALFAVMLLFIIAPGGIYTLPYPWNNAYVIAQAVIWLAAMVFFGALAIRLKPGITR